MPDFFGRTPQTVGQGIGVDGAVITFNDTSGGTTTGLKILVTGLTVNYTQQMSRAYDITKSNVHLIQGRPTGNGRMDSIAGVRRLVAGFMQRYGNVCTIQENKLNLAFATKCDTDVGEGEDYTISGVLVNGVNMAVQGETMVVQQQLTFEFISLEDKNFGPIASAGTGVAGDGGALGDDITGTGP